MRFSIVVALCLPLLFGGCFDYDDVEFVRLGGMKLEEMGDRSATVNLQIELMNPNPYTITVRPSEVDVFVNGEEVGKAYLLNKLSIKRKKTRIVDARIKLDGVEGILFKLMKWRLKENIEVRFVGKVKGGVFGITKKFDVDETKTVDPSKLKLDLLKR